MIKNYYKTKKKLKDTSLITLGRLLLLLKKIYLQFCFCNDTDYKISRYLSIAWALVRVLRLILLLFFFLLEGASEIFVAMYVHTHTHTDTHTHTHTHKHIVFHPCLPAAMMCRK
jgi:hypothetical protein